MSQQALDDILNDTVAPEVAEAPEPEPQSEVREEQPRDDSGKFVAKGEPEEPAGVSPTPQTVTEPPLDHAALLGERRRRQEAERRAAELEEQIKQRTEQPAQQAPDMFEDPAGYTAWLKQEAKREALEEFQGRTQQSTFETRLEVTELMARQKYADFEEKLSVFEDMVKTNPTLVAELKRQQNPAEYAYTTAKNYSDVQKMGTFDMDAIKEKLRAEILAEEAAKLSRKPIPTSLATERNVGTRSGPAWSGPRSMSELLG